MSAHKGAAFLIGENVMKIKGILIEKYKYYLVGTQAGYVGGLLMATIDSVNGNFIEIYAFKDIFRIAEKDIIYIQPIEQVEQATKNNE